MDKEKYTANEWAAIQGGHTIEPETTGLSFIQSLGEARMFKTRDQIKKEGARSVTDHLFVSLLSLYTMSNDFRYAPVATEYAKKTMQNGGFNTPHPGGTDLYQTLFTIKKPNGILDGAADSALLDKVRLNDVHIKKFLRDVSNGKTTPGAAQAFFFRLERELAIQDPKLRAARRLAQNWTTLSTSQQQLVATQLSRYYKVHAKRSDLNALFTNFAKDSGLEVDDSKLKKIGKRVARGAAAFAAGYAAGKMTEL